MQYFKAESEHPPAASPASLMHAHVWFKENKNKIRQWAVTAFFIQHFVMFSHVTTSFFFQSCILHCSLGSQSIIDG